MVSVVTRIRLSTDPKQEGRTQVAQLATTQPAGYVTLVMRFFKEEDQWVGECEELGVATCGDSIEEARKGLEDLMILALNTMESIGERERFFADNDITIHSLDQPTPQKSYDLLTNVYLAKSEPIPVGV